MKIKLLMLLTIGLFSISSIKPFSGGEDLPPVEDQSSEIIDQN